MFPFIPTEETSAFQEPSNGFTSALNVIYVFDVFDDLVANGTTFHSTKRLFMVVEYLTYVSESTFHQSRKLI